MSNASVLLVESEKAAFRHSPTARAVRPIPLTPKFGVWGGHLQTTHLTFRNDHPDVSGMNPTPFEAPMEDGSGDRLTGVIHTPEVQKYPGVLVVAGHGFGGDADSAYMRWITKFFYEQGIATCRLNMRGAGTSRPLCQQEYHAARGEDLIRLWTWLLNHAGDKVPFRIERVYFAGTSLSGNILANAFSKMENNGICADSDLAGVIGGMGLCFALDMPCAARQIHSGFNWPYLQYLLGKIKPLFEQHPTADPALKAKIAAAKTMFEIDDLWTAPSLGLSSAAVYYEWASTSNYIGRTQRPLRVVGTMDDPWISPKPFLNYHWNNPLLEPRLFETGGHCGLWEQGFTYQRHFREALDHLESLL